MPRFHFNFHDGSLIPDVRGTELASLESARREAMRRASEILAKQEEAFWNGTLWTVSVTDEAGIVLFELNFSARVEPDTHGGGMRN